jgi:hypothetical protein
MQYSATPLVAALTCASALKFFATVGGDALPPKPTVPPAQYTNSWILSVVCFYLVSGGDIRIRIGTLVVTAAWLR